MTSEHDFQEICVAFLSVWLGARIAGMAHGLAVGRGLAVGFGGDMYVCI